MGDHWGTLFRIESFGESHGPGIGVVISGCPANVPLDFDLIQQELNRRRPGQSRLTTKRQEADKVEYLSGIYSGKTTGSALTMIVYNTDAKSRSYEDFQDLYRPSHADFTYEAKYGIRDWRGGGRASARETIARVAAGAVAQQILREFYQITVNSWVSGIHSVRLPLTYGRYSREQIESNEVRCPEPKFAGQMIETILEAQRQGDSVGGYVSCRISNVPAGLGDPPFDKLEADLAKAMLSIPACRGFEIGSGFQAADYKGSTHNDPFVPAIRPAGEKQIGTNSNHSGGIQGGISNGEDILFRVVFKPTATIFHDQKTVDRSGAEAILKAKGRHDPCVVPRAVPIVDAMAALTILDHILRQEAYHRFQPGISSERTFSEPFRLKEYDHDTKQKQ